MDQPHNQPLPTSRPRYRLIGILGKTTLTNHEATELYYLGRCIAILGHRLASIPARGTVTQVTRGATTQGGTTVTLQQGVIDASDHTFIYPDKRLLYRLLAVYPDLHTRTDVTIIETTQLHPWNNAVTQLIEEKGLTPPTR